MTVKELKEALSQFNDKFTVLMPKSDFENSESLFPYTSRINISQGINELDCAVIIDDYGEEEP